MDSLEFHTNDELTEFFHLRKTEMSCMEQPHIFLNQLRDHNLIPENKYKKVIRAKSKQVRERGMYDLLDWLETKRPNNIRLFWNCVFKDHVLQQYPVLRVMRNSLLDGSFTFTEKLPEKEEHMEAEDGKQVKGRKKRMKKKEESMKTRATKKGEGKNREKTRNKRNREETESSEEEQPGPSSQATPIKKRLRKPRYGSPLKKGTNADIWNWPLYKTNFPVTCGDKKGTLYREKLGRGEKCILAEQCWFSPIEFEEFAGKKACRNWKTTICCRGTTLRKLIQAGHLKCGKFNSLSQRNQQGDQESEQEGRPHFSNQEESSISESDSENGEAEEEEEAEEDQPANHSESNNARIVGNGEEDASKFTGKCLPVTCGSAKGTLKKDRFVSGIKGKCIRTEDKWLTPVDFLKEDPTSHDLQWMKRILCLGKPLSHLLKVKVLGFHRILCECGLCRGQDQDLREQDNDDDCFICDRPGFLLCCDQCPRAFHYKCHLPALNPRTVGEKWMCTYCVLKTSQAWRYPRQITLQMALESPVSDHLLHCQYLLLCLYKGDKQQVFKSNPRHTVSHGKTVIDQPMWLDEIAERLKSKYYSRVDQFCSDVQQVFQNQGNISGQLSTRLTNVFEEEFRKVFLIQP